MGRFLVHANAHQLCAVDTETTGLIPGYHEIVQFSVLPLDSNFEPAQDLPPFDIMIKPEHPNRAEPEAIRKIGREQFSLCVKEGLSLDAAVELFEMWFEQKLNIGEHKRILVLAHNWPFDYSMLQAMLGVEHMGHFFDGRARDTLCVANYCNDRADVDREQIPFPGKLSLTSIATRCGIEFDAAAVHQSLYDCWLCAKVYKTLLKQFFVAV